MNELTYENLMGISGGRSVLDSVNNSENGKKMIVSLCTNQIENLTVSVDYLTEEMIIDFTTDAKFGITNFYYLDQLTNIKTVNTAIRVLRDNS